MEAEIYPHPIIMPKWFADTEGMQNFRRRMANDVENWLIVISRSLHMYFCVPSVSASDVSTLFVCWVVLPKIHLIIEIAGLTRLMAFTRTIRWKICLWTIFETTKHPYNKSWLVRLSIINTFHLSLFILGISPSWFVEFVGVTNEVTGHVYK